MPRKRKTPSSYFSHRWVGDADQVAFHRLLKSICAENGAKLTRVPPKVRKQIKLVYPEVSFTPNDDGTFRTSGRVSARKQKQLFSQYLLRLTKTHNR